MPRIVQISDPHVSHRQDHFVDNFCRALAAADALAPDLIVVTGDITINGADDPAELAFARHLARSTHAPLVFIPGNHDIGEEPGAIDAGQPVTPERLAAWTSVFGPDRAAMRLGAWHVLALNSQLFGTGLPEEAAQWAWFDAALAEADGAPVALFLHKPLFITARTEAADGIWSVPAAARDRLNLLGASGLIRLFGSGHLHQGAVRAIGRAGHVWAPSCGFPSDSARLPSAGLAPGFVRYDLRDAGGWSAELTYPDDLASIDFRALLARHGVSRLSDLPAAPERKAG